MEVRVVRPSASRGAKMSGEQAFLNWLNRQDGYYVRDDVVEEKFPNLKFRMIGVTKILNDDGTTSTPIRDWRQAVKYGGVSD